MKLQRFEWAGAATTAAAVRSWSSEAAPPVEVEPIGGLVREGGDAALLALTRRYDVTDGEIEKIRVDPADAQAALAAMEAPLREAYRAMCGTLGRRVRVELPDGSTLVGEATDVEEAGRLVVRTDDGEHLLNAGDVVHVR